MAYNAELSNKTIQELNNELRDLNKRTEAHIVKMMNDSGLNLISFASNGDNNSFDVDKSYMDIEIGDDVMSVEVMAVVCKDDNLYLIPEPETANLRSKSLNLLSENIILPLNEVPADILEDLLHKSYVTDATFAPAVTLNELLFSVSETIEVVMEKNESR